MSCISLVLENIEKKDISLIFTLCLSAPAESALKNSLVKFWSVKPLPAEKGLNFQPPRCILLNLIHPRGSWVIDIPRPYSELQPDEFWYYPDNNNNIIIIFVCFYQFFMVSWEL